MVDQQHLDILKQGVDVWNKWRERHPDILPDLRKANLRKANLFRADLFGADLRKAKLWGAILTGADLRTADLTGADLRKADLRKADLFGADLREANLNTATLVETNLSGATLTRCSVYGISAWNVKLEGAIQDDLVITPDNEPTITVDNLEVAQFIYLLLNNQKIREVIDTITSKVVLILGGSPLHWGNTACSLEIIFPGEEERSGMMRQASGSSGS